MFSFKSFTQLHIKTALRLHSSINQTSFRSIMGSVFGQTSGYESPQFKVLSKAKSYEIRFYSETIAIDAPTSRGNDGNGFSALAKYIGVGATPSNDRSEAISMTAPVVTYDHDDEKQSQDTRMQFILPSKLQNPPNPLDSNLRVIRRDSAVFAVMTFSGLVDHQQAEEKQNEFVQTLKSDKVPLKEPVEWELWRFNPPWTLPWMRTNEIAVKLEKSQFEEAINSS